MTVAKRGWRSLAHDSPPGCGRYDLLGKVGRCNRQHQHGQPLSRIAISNSFAPCCALTLADGELIPRRSGGMAGWETIIQQAPGHLWIAVSDSQAICPQVYERGHNRKAQALKHLSKGQLPYIFWDSATSQFGTGLGCVRYSPVVEHRCLQIGRCAA